ncbi:MAG TPA: response regulator [Acidimicrobiia bacterium]|nr:response regulator [Acidimicrobiia bacterium]
MATGKRAPGSVLVVDDEEDLRILLRLELEAEGARVWEASSGAEAIDILATTTVDVMLLDLALPDMDGFEVLERLGERGDLPRMRVIVVSAHADENRVRRARAAGCDAYLYKPFSSAELWAAVSPGDAGET